MRREVLTEGERAAETWRAELEVWQLRPWWSRLWRRLTFRAP